jgi:hypothetical protein
LAGDWIKFELATLDKPEVIAMAETLGTSSYDVVGRLLRVWGWFDQQTENGNALSVTGNALKRFIDRIAESQGFASTMQKVGWLDDDGLPNFDRHNGESSKTRAGTKRLRNADAVTKSFPEKRREDRTPIVPESPKFAEFWNAYPGPRKIQKAKCREVWTKQGFEIVGDQIILHVAAMAATRSWQDKDGKFVPAPLTYLNQRRFEDGMPETARARLVV